MQNSRLPETMTHARGENAGEQRHGIRNGCSLTSTVEWVYERTVSTQQGFPDMRLIALTTKTWGCIPMRIRQ